MNAFTLAHRIAGPDPSTPRNAALQLLTNSFNVASLGGAGTYPLLDVKDDDIVLALWVVVTTALSGGGTPGGIIGDDGDTNRFLDTFTATPAAFITPYKYAADNTIDIVVAAGTTAGIGQVFALVYRP